VGELLEKLESMFPGLKDRICDEQGALRRYVNMFVNENGLEHETAQQAELRSNDTVHILPSIAGGA
jgi:molybdopterin synthase sulfur carrier subunit